MNDITDKQKFGFVAVIGEPNAGKSTLINNMVGTKISIVSPKVQTTRTRVLGIALHDQSQIVFVDTPGIFNPPKKGDGQKKMERAIVASAWEGIANAEIILLLVDVSKKIGDATKMILERLEHETGKRVILVLNKVDKIKREALLDISLRLNGSYNFEATFMVSALKGNGVPDLIEHISGKLPYEAWHYPEDQITDMPMRLMAAEVTREKLFKMTHNELPYQLTVETQSWKDFDDGSIKIDQIIYIAREAHKKIILGKGGSMIKKIGQTARVELEEILETTVHLKLFVKVNKNWLDEEEYYNIWGLDSDI